MTYTQKPDTGTLFTNDRKAQENHPDYNGKLLISRDLLEKLAKYGEGMIEVSAWVKTTKSGNTILNLQCKEPYKSGVQSQEPPTNYQESIQHLSPAPAPAPKSQRTPQQLAELKLGQLKERLAAINEYPKFEELYALVHEPDRWNIFKAVPAIAQEASDLLSK